MRKLATFNIKTTADLKRMLRYIEKQTQDSLRLISFEVEKMMKDYVIKALYQSYQPKDYLRSMNYINSLTVKKVSKNGAGELETEIFFDPNKIYSREMEGKYWNQHMSVNGDSSWGGRPISEWLPIFIERGVSGSLWDREGIEVVDTILKELNSNSTYKNMMMKELKRKGFNVQ